MTKSCPFLFCLLVLPVASAQVQEPPATEDVEAKKRMALVRGWILPSEKAPFRLRLNTNGEGGVPGERALAQTTDAARATGGNYAEVPSGNCQVEVLGEDGKVLAFAPASLRARRFYTIVAAQDGKGKWSLDAFADGPAEGEAQSRPVRVLNFAGEWQAVLEAGGSQPLKVPSQSIAESKYPSKLLGFEVKVLDPNGGAPGQSSTEIDLSIYPSAYVVIAPDYRGRMRPRIIEGGEPKYPDETAAGLPIPSSEEL